MAINDIPEHMRYLIEDQEGRTPGFFRDWRVTKFFNPNYQAPVQEEDCVTETRAPDFGTASNVANGRQLLQIDPATGLVKQIGSWDDFKDPFGVYESPRCSDKDEIK